MTRPETPVGTPSRLMRTGRTMPTRPLPRISAPAPSSRETTLCSACSMDRIVPADWPSQCSPAAELASAAATRLLPRRHATRCRRCCSLISKEAEGRISSYVMPAKAGIQGERLNLELWIPAFAGMTTRGDGLSSDSMHVDVHHLVAWWRCGGGGGLLLLAGPGGLDLLRRDLAGGDQRVMHSRGALLRQLHVVGWRAGRVGAADDRHLRFGLAGHPLGDAVDRLLARRLDAVGIRGEVDVIGVDRHRLRTGTGRQDGKTDKGGQTHP